jgi:cobalt-zinc-cadmium efflux system protein
VIITPNMAHDHHQGQPHDHAGPHRPRLLVGAGGGPRSAAARASEQRRLAATLAVTVLGMLIEGVGGWLTNSLALLSDAGHMLADVGAIALSLFALRIASRPADARRTYGYYRLEILAALANGAVLIAIAVGIAVEAYQRLQHPEPVRYGTVIGIALVGIGLNGVGMWITHGGESQSMNLRSTFLHLGGDLLNSVGVLLAAGLIAWTGQLRWDPVVSFFIAATIVWGAWRLCREAVDVLLEGVPPHLALEEVYGALGGLPGVSAVHDLHVWTITSGMVSLSCHLVVVCEGPGCRSHDDILSDARALLKQRFKIEHTTIQFESQSYHHEELVH